MSALPGRQHERGIPLSNSPFGRGAALHTPRQRFAAAPRPAPGAGPDETPHRPHQLTGTVTQTWTYATPYYSTLHSPHAPVFPDPTFATCHMSGFGSAGTTHDIGDRPIWFLFAPISSRRPAWQDNRVRIQGVCRECHNQNFNTESYAAADASTEQVNSWVNGSNELIAPLKEHDLLSAAPSDEPIDLTWPPKTGPGNMLELGRRKGDRWPRGDIRRSR